MQFLSGILKAFWLIMIIITNSYFVFGLNINEMEQNPAGQDSGNEWVELYSETEINLEGYYLQADDKIYNLSASFSGFLVVVFEGQFLDNKDEAVFLKNSQGLIDQTPFLNDSENNEKTWQKCNNTWIFKNATKNADNNCNVQQNLENAGNNNPQNSGEEEINNSNNNSESALQQNNNVNNANLVLTNNFVQQSRKIVLNKISDDKGNEDNFISKQEKVRRGVLYSFIVFLVILVILLGLRRL